MLESKTQWSALVIQVLLLINTVKEKSISYLIYFTKDKVFDMIEKE